MNYSLLHPAICIVLSTALIAACGKHPKPDAAPSTVSIAVGDPLIDFQTIVSRCKSALAAPEPERVWRPDQADRWMKTVSSPYEISYDVRKSDSLVSPYSGVMEVSFHKAIVTRDTETTARSAEISAPLPGDLLEENRFRLNYAYVDKAWKFTSLLHRYTVAPISKTEGRFAEAPNEDFLKEIKTGAACIQASGS